MKNAVERAKAEAKNLMVRRAAELRVYTVENKINGNRYTVRFAVEGNRRFGQCDCKAGQSGRFACKHLAAAAALNITLAERGLLNNLQTV